MIALEARPRRPRLDRGTAGGERLERGLFDLRRDLDLPLALPPINRDLARPNLAIMSAVAVSGPVRLVPHPETLLSFLLPLLRTPLPCGAAHDAGRNFFQTSQNR